MSFLDIIIGILLVWGLYKGLKNGLFVELASLIALIAGIYGAIHFSYITGDYLAEQFDWSDQYLKIAAFLITFFCHHHCSELGRKIPDQDCRFCHARTFEQNCWGYFWCAKGRRNFGGIPYFLRKACLSLGTDQRGNQRTIRFLQSYQGNRKFSILLCFG